MPRPTGGVSYGTRVPVREGTGVVPGPLGAFPGAPRCEGQSGRGSGEAREGRLFPIGPRSLRLLKRRGFGESSTKPRAERGMRPRIGPPLPGPGGSEGGVGGTWVGWGLASRGLHPSQTPRAPQLPEGCCGLRPRRPSSGAGGRGGGGEVPVFGVVADSGFLLVDLELPVPLPRRPARCQTPGVSGVRRWEGRAGASTSSLLLATGFVPLARPGAHSVSKVGPHPPGSVSVL